MKEFHPGLPPHTVAIGFALVIRGKILASTTCRNFCKAGSAVGWRKFWTSGQDLYIQIIAGVSYLNSGHLSWICRCDINTPDRQGETLYNAQDHHVTGIAVTKRTAEASSGLPGIDRITRSAKPTDLARSVNNLLCSCWSRCTNIASLNPRDIPLKCGWGLRGTGHMLVTLFWRLSSTAGWSLTKGIPRRFNLYLSPMPDSFSSFDVCKAPAWGPQG